MSHPIMKCGHNGHLLDNIFICNLCDETEVSDTIDLSERAAICECCGSIKPSDYKLENFQLLLSKQYDSFTCECSRKPLRTHPNFR